MSGKDNEYKLTLKADNSEYVVVRFDDPKPSLLVKGHERTFREMKISYFDFHLITSKEVKLEIGEIYGYDLNHLREIVAAKFPAGKSLEKIVNGEEVIELESRDMVKLDKEMEIVDHIEEE